MKEGVKNSYSRVATGDLLTACLEFDRMHFTEALQNGANPRAHDDHGNPVWQLLLSHPKSYFVSETDRAEMLGALFELPFELNAAMFEVMVEDIQENDLPLCGIEFLKAARGAPAGSRMSDAQCLLNTPWWGALISSLDANSIDEHTLDVHPQHKTPRL